MIKPTRLDEVNKKLPLRPETRCQNSFHAILKLRNFRFFYFFTKNFFENLVFFGVLHRSCQNAKKYQLFEKNFRVPPPIANTGLPKCPPVACPGRHYTTSILSLNFSIAILKFMEKMLLYH